jgi:ELWxxDGT repeat protein
MKTHLPDKIKISALLILFFALFSTSPYAQVIQKLKDLRAGNSFPFDFTISGAKLFFIASDDVNVGLWVTDGTTTGTVKLTPSTGPANTSFDIAAYDNKVYFSYNDGVNGYELWVSDGTVAGTGLFKDLYVGSNGSNPRYFTVANNKLFFIADDINSTQRLFVSDGTAAGTMLIKNYATLFNGLSTFAILNNDIYFTSDDGTGAGYGLWKSNGTLAGTVLLRPNISSSSGANYAVLGNTLFFDSNDGINGSELWTTDGTPAGTNMVINLRADGGGIFYSGAPFNFITYNNKVYFTASDDVHGAELFSSDGTAAGTQMVKDMQPGAEGSVPQQSVIFNGNLYFSCYNGNVATGLWKSDGTTAGTTLIKQGGGGDPFLRDTKFAPVFNGKLYFIVNDLQFYPLWETDGTIAGTKLVIFQNTPSPAFSTSVLGEFGFALYNSELYFGGTCGTISQDIEPCKITTGVLPVTWLGVQAQWQNIATAKISWQVADQINVKNYTTQHTTDGIVYTDVCTVAASNSTNYNCTVPANSTIKNYYRVLQLDIDGKKTYSKVVVLQSGTASPLVIYPNPAKDKLYINGLTNYNELKIADVNGRIIQRRNNLAGFRFINISQLNTGVYLLTATGDKGTQTIKFIKH